MGGSIACMRRHEGIVPEKGTILSTTGTGNGRRHAAEPRKYHGNGLEASAEVWNMC